MRKKKEVEAYWYLPMNVLTLDIEEDDFTFYMFCYWNCTSYIYLLGLVLIFVI